MLTVLKRHYPDLAPALRGRRQRLQAMAQRRSRRCTCRVVIARSSFRTHGPQRALLRRAQPSAAGTHPRTSCAASTKRPWRPWRPGRRRAAEAPGIQRRADRSRLRVSARHAARVPSAGPPRAARRCAEPSASSSSSWISRDAPMTATPDHFRDLFFSTGKIPTGSVREYFTEVAHGLMTLDGEVVGPYRLPRTLAEYAGGKAGTDNPEPNARTMARDAAVLANADVDFAPYDNDGNGFVDAFIVVHAGSGRRGNRQRGSHLVAQVGVQRRPVRRRRHQDLRLPDDSRGLQDWRVRARARTPACSAGPTSTTRTDRAKAWATGA